MLVRTNKIIILIVSYQCWFIYTIRNSLINIIFCCQMFSNCRRAVYLTNLTLSRFLSLKSTSVVFLIILGSIKRLSTQELQTATVFSIGQGEFLILKLLFISISSSKLLSIKLVLVFVQKEMYQFYYHYHVRKTSTKDINWQLINQNTFLIQHQNIPSFLSDRKSISKSYHIILNLYLEIFTDDKLMVLVIG